MLERGSTSFQMSEVSERCNMSKGALYYYFTDRNELIEVVFAEAIQHSVEVAEQIVEQAASAEEALHELCINFGNQLQTNSMLVLAATYEYSNSSGMVSFVRQNLEHAADLISQQMERAKQKGIIREDVNTKIAGGFMFGGFLMASLAVANSSESVDAEKASEMIYSLAIQGLKPR